MNVDYPERLKLAQTPTPLIPLDRLSAHVNGPRIWVKRDDMTGGAVSGNKIRKLEFTLARAIAQGCDTIITAGGVQSNHCRTTALVCAQLGLQCHLILRGEDTVTDGNLLLDRLAGARISFCTNEEYQRHQQTLFEHWCEYYSGQGSSVYCVPVGASDGTGLWGYVAACEELAADFKQLEISPKYIFCATGSGGTQGGLMAGCELYGLDARVWGVNVCDDKAYFQRKVKADLREWKRMYSQVLDIDAMEVNVLEGYVGLGYAKATEQVFDTIKLAGQLEGLVLDPVYTGKAFHGLLDQIKQGRFTEAEDIIFIHTGGIFGLFPQREQLNFA
ncbi:D-cysteine desulfhydrase family protein [bacterium AH-315-K03]|nr:D-cysteine desulfhydrase family protein [bacterium AH-315-K03]